MLLETVMHHDTWSLSAGRFGISRLRAWLQEAVRENSLICTLDSSIGMRICFRYPKVMKIDHFVYVPV